MQNLVEKNPRTSTPSDDNKPTKQFKLDPNIRLDGTPLYLLKGLTEKNIEALYLLAHHLYEEGRYEEACPFFQLMAFLNNQDKRAWLGAAACLEAKKEYKAAIGCYGCAAVLDETDPMPFFRSFNCHLENNDQKKAITALEAAIEIANKEEGRYADLKEQAKKIKEALLQ